MSMAVPIQSSPGMAHQNSASDPGEISDAETPQTPTLTGSASTLSLGDSPLQSPSSIVFPSASHSSSGQPLVYSSSRIILEGNCKAWWGRRTSADSSNSTGALDLRPCERLPGRPPSHNTDEVAEGSLLRSSDPVSTSAAPPNDCGEAVPKPKTMSPTAETELSAEFRKMAGPSYLSMPGPQRIDHSAVTEELSQLLTSPWPDPGLTTAQPLPSVCVNGVPSSTGTGVAGGTYSSSPPVPRLSVPQQDLAPASEVSCAGAGSSRLDLSHGNSSMLAHCGHKSLVPPCEGLAQTQCGRMTLRQAGIAHGSPRALAPSLPVENVPVRPHSRGFFQRLVRKTFTKSPSMFSSSSARLPSLSLDSPGGESLKLPRSRTARHSMLPVFARTEPALESQTPAPVKPSRWAIIQRLVVRPSSATRATEAETSRQAHSQSIASSTRSGMAATLTSGRSSSLSFFGDPQARVDPFARSGGLGATVSVSSSPEPFNHSRPYLREGYQAHIVNNYAHIVGLSTEGGRGQSLDEGIGYAGPLNHRVPLHCEVFYRSSASQVPTDNPAPPVSPVHDEFKGRRPEYMGGRSTTDRVFRRHSAPLLNRTSPLAIADSHRGACM